MRTGLTGTAIAMLEQYGWRFAACPFCGDDQVEPRVGNSTISAACQARDCRATVDFDIERDAWRRMGFEGVLHDVVTKYNRRAP